LFPFALESDRPRTPHNTLVIERGEATSGPRNVSLIDRTM
jgi:hypothetical protein